MYLDYHHGNKLFPPKPMLQRKKRLFIFFNWKRLREFLKFLLVAPDFNFVGINNNHDHFKENVGMNMKLMLLVHLLHICLSHMQDTTLYCSPVLG